MSLIVVGYPKVSPEDLRRIQGIRTEHDRLYHRVISKHFTLVFPATDADPGRLVQHVEERTEGRHEFRVDERGHPTPRYEKQSWPGPTVPHASLDRLLARPHGRIKEL